MKRLCSFFCWWLLLGGILVYAQEEGHCPVFESIPSLKASYSIVDIGETDIDPSRLARTARRQTLGPRINNDGVIIGNTSSGGFVTLLDRWAFAPQIEGMTIHFHDINNRGDLLVALYRGQDSIEWMRWPYREGSYGTFREHINTVDPFKGRFYVTGINDDSYVVAYGKGSDCLYRPLVWDPCSGLERLGSKQNLEIKGTARAISNNGTVTGVFDSISDQTPYVWNPQCGLLVANSYRQKLDPTGWVEFVDLLVAEDSTVYGTYRIKHLAETHVIRGHYYEVRKSNGSFYGYNAFMWEPSSGQIGTLDLQGMRLTAVNKDHVLVGSIVDEAALRMPGKAPVLLASLMEPDEVKDWKLLEISDINDRGQVVGYGWYQDKLHFFLANPLE